MRHTRVFASLPVCSKVLGAWAVGQRVEGGSFKSPNRSQLWWTRKITDVDKFKKRNETAHFVLDWSLSDRGVGMRLAQHGRNPFPQLDDDSTTSLLIAQCWCKLSCVKLAGCILL